MISSGLHYHLFPKWRYADAGVLQPWRWQGLAEYLLVHDYIYREEIQELLARKLQTQSDHLWMENFKFSFKQHVHSW